MEASTKAGKTQGCLLWLLDQALASTVVGENYWWVAPVFAQAAIAYKRLKRQIPAHLCKTNDTDKTITLFNGAVIWFKSGDSPDNLYGDDVKAAVVDEASRLKEDSWHAVRSVLTKTRGRVRIIGNVKGRKNWFYVMARKAQQGDPDMAFHKITALDAVAAGVLDGEEIEDARRLLPDNVFRELYLAEPSDDGGNPFGMKAIRDCVANTLERPKAGKFYFVGVDLAKSVDFTVAIAMDENGRVVGFDRWQSSWDETMRRVQAFASYWNKAKICADATGVGDPIVEQLQSMEYIEMPEYHYTCQAR